MNCSSIKISRELLDLYEEACSVTSAYSQSEIIEKLSEIHDRAKQLESTAAQETFSRYSRLIHNRMRDIGDTNCADDRSRCDSIKEETTSKKSRSQLGRKAHSTNRPLRVLVSGIGRSGTTLIYQQLARLLLEGDHETQFHYEPYLWNITTGNKNGIKFNMERLSRFGLYVHTQTPLFIDGSHKLHDQFADMLFDPSQKATDDSQITACLAKVIRGSGRLRSFLERYPDLKVIACLRNPLDTINSSLGMFSFFGEEFHVSDRGRFLAEWNAWTRSRLKIDEEHRGVEWSAAWWRAFTEEMLSVSEDYPNNVFPFCFEEFENRPAEMLRRIQEFVGVKNDGINVGLEEDAGPRSKTISLTSHDFHAIKNQIVYYQDTVLAPRLGRMGSIEHSRKLTSRFMQREFAFPVAGSDIGCKSPIELRGLIMNGGTTPFLNLVRGSVYPFEYKTIVNLHAGGDESEAIFKPEPAGARIKKGRRFGVVITCHNNADTIVGAVLSCLQQTVPFDEIVIVDDCSSDKSYEKIDVLNKLYSSISVVQCESNVGPSAARDVGIARLKTDYCTQLDGDDVFWPTKNEAEVAAINDGDGAVAFSDILVVDANSSFVRDTSAYHGIGGEKACEKLLARDAQIPRDMTFARSAYFEAGGYDRTLGLYEDWEFKLRLAKLGGLWRRSASTAGTIYNRISPGLSGADRGTHARALSLIFLSALPFAELRGVDVLKSYDAALAQFREQRIYTALRGWLEEEVREDRYDANVFAEFARMSEVSGMTADEVCDHISAEVAR